MSSEATQTSSAAFPPAPPVPPPPGQTTLPPTAAPVLSAPKSRLGAAALAIVLGSFGAHKFYMGKVQQGILYLVFCWAYIPGILGLIEGMTYLAKTDEDWAAEHSWPVERSSGVAVAVLWFLALLPALSIAVIIALIFLGSQASTTLQ